MPSNACAKNWWSVMSDQVVAQLGLAARALDSAARPFTADEVKRRAAHDFLDWELELFGQPPIEVDDADAGRAYRRRPLWLVAAAAAVLLIGAAGSLALGTQRSSLNDPSDGAKVKLPTTAQTASTLDPLIDFGRPPGEWPADLVQRFTSSVGDFGQIWFYDSATTNRIYFVRRGGDGSSYGYFDHATYDAGLAWGLEGRPGPDLLYGLASPSMAVAISVGDIIVPSDQNGFWYTIAPEGLENFAITTRDGTVKVEPAATVERTQTTAVAPND